MANQEPTLLNKSAAIGALSCGLAASVIPGAQPLALAAVAAAAGAGVGGAVGKNRMEREQEEGVAAKPPSMWNRDALLGGLLGLAAARILTFGALSLASTLSVEGIGAVVASTPVIAIVATTVTLAMTVGLYLGGRYGKKCAESEYETQMRETMGKMLDHSMVPALSRQIFGAGLDELPAVERKFTERLLEQQQQQGAPIPPR